MKHTTAFILLSLIPATGICHAGEHSAIQASADETYQASIAADGVQYVNIIGGNYFFRPNHVIVHAHVPVEFSVTLEKSIVPHSLIIDAPEAGIRVDEKLGSETKKLRFTPTAAGNYPFYCKNKLLFLNSHRDKGMKGVLEVVE